MSDFSPFADTIRLARYSKTPDGKPETWAETARRVAWGVMSAVGAPPVLTAEIERLIRERKFLPGGRYLAATGREIHQVQNCLLLRAKDSREGWAEHLSHVTMALMTGAGVGAVYSDLREEGAPIKRTGGFASGPIALMQATNEVGRAAKSGGNRRAALWASLRWDHPDVFKFIKAKNWPDEIKALKEKDFDFPATLDHTNISVGINDHFFAAYADATDALHTHAHDVFWLVVRQMVETAEPGFSVDIGGNAGEDLRNACTEITSRDDSDVCNLGSINLARIWTVEEMRNVVDCATAFLLAGTVYSDLPYAKVGLTRERNRRLGLGLMGVHEWLIRRGYNYAPTGALVPYLDEYAQSTEVARRWASAFGVSTPIKTRAIAPTGTIGIVAETTTGIEPIFAIAYKRRYRGGTDASEKAYQMVIDPTARRLIEEGADPDAIEDAMTLAADPDRRLGFQAWMQTWVDHGISSTINLPRWGSPSNNPDTVRGFGETLLKHLPMLRGVTAYPDGSRGGQPLTPVPYREAIAREGEIVIEQADVCELGKGGSCGA